MAIPYDLDHVYDKEQSCDRFRCAAFWIGIFTFVLKGEIHVCDMIQTVLDDEKQNVFAHFGFLYYSNVSAMCIKKRDICVIICLKRESSQD